MSATTPTAKEVLGIPVLPPGSATVLMNRLRARLGRIHRAIAPPPVQILEATFAVLEHRVLVALCAARVPDELTGRTEIAELAARTGSDPAALERLVRFAATRGWVRIDRRGRVRPTTVTEFLRADHPGGWRAWVDFAGGEEIVAAIGAISATTGPRDPFEASNGAPFFEWMAGHPSRWETFDAAMAAGARIHGLGLAATLDWAGATSVCDVGGGTGSLLATLLDLETPLSGTVFDLPEVVARCIDHPRLTVLGGDMFEGVPEGFDIYLLVNVVHDWGDDESIVLLGRVRDAARRGSRIVVVDQQRAAVPQPDIATSTDVLMAALTGGGKERTVDEFAALGAQAGLRLDATHRLPSADLAMVFRPASPDGALA